MVMALAMSKEAKATVTEKNNGVIELSGKSSDQLSDGSVIGKTCEDRNEKQVSEISKTLKDKQVLYFKQV